ncbi:MAG: DUF2628 domain-containing protein [Eubacterium sp.]|nr:DUF2628 domain-containing protein [Eubacterium sp.]
MFLYENNKCPVCSKKFEEGDDVVVCPDCGTPHHRECYQSLGKCANKDKHETDFVYDRDKYKEENAEEIVQEKIFNLADEVKTVVEALDNADAPKDETPVSDVKQKESNEPTIDGVPVSDVKTVVGVRTERFLHRFSKKRKLGWNWGAFFFGPYYFMYRKMFGESLVFLAIPFVVNLIINNVFSSAMLVLKNIFDEMSAIIVTYDTQKMAAFLKSSIAAPENKQAWMVILITLAVSFGIRIIAALIADNQYRKRVVKIIKIVDEKVDLGESFSLVGPVMGSENMSQSDLRRMFLAKQGGVNILFPFILFAIAFFSNLI